MRRFVVVYFFYMKQKFQREFNCRYSLAVANICLNIEYIFD